MLLLGISARIPNQSNTTKKKTHALTHARADASTHGRIIQNARTYHTNARTRQRTNEHAAINKRPEKKKKTDRPGEQAKRSLGSSSAPFHRTFRRLLRRSSPQPPPPPPCEQDGSGRPPSRRSRRWSTGREFLGPWGFPVFFRHC